MRLIILVSLLFIAGCEDKNSNQKDLSSAADPIWESTICSKTLEEHLDCTDQEIVCLKNIELKNISGTEALEEAKNCTKPGSRCVETSISQFVLQINRLNNNSGDFQCVSPAASICVYNLNGSMKAYQLIEAALACLDDNVVVFN